MYALYSALAALFLVVTLPYWLLQMMRHGKYRAGLRQRFGAVPPSLVARGEQRTIWVHAVSVGEVIGSGAAAEISVVPRARFHHNQHGAKTGSEAIRRGECFLFSSRLRAGDSALSRYFAPGTRCRRGHGILAEFSAAGQARRSSHRGHQLSIFRPRVSEL